MGAYKKEKHQMKCSAWGKRDENIRLQVKDRGGKEAEEEEK